MEKKEDIRTVAFGQDGKEIIINDTYFLKDGKKYIKFYYQDTERKEKVNKVMKTKITNYQEFKQSLKDASFANLFLPFYSLDNLFFTPKEEEKKEKEKVEDKKEEGEGEGEEDKKDKKKEEIKKLEEEEEKYKDLLYNRNIYYAKDIILSEEDRKTFFSKTLPFIQDLVLKTESIFTNNPIPVLSICKSGIVTLTHLQCACILANSFYSTFSRRSEDQCMKMMNIPTINLDHLFTGKGNVEQRIAKIKMFLNYFKRISESISDGNVHFIRQNYELEYIKIEENKDKDNDEEDNDDEDKGKGKGRGRIKKTIIKDLGEFEKINNEMVDAEVKEGKIEDCENARHVDFANAFIGGASISYGIVQEEILFSVKPELNVARLFCEKMANNESIIIKGAEQFSQYSGYSRSLKFKSDFIDKNKENHDCSVAMDALFISGRHEKQWDRPSIDRELIKCVTGYLDKKETLDLIKPFSAIATGNWGCGAFNGNSELKSIIQWLAASIAKKKFYYHPFSNKKLFKLLPIVIKGIREKKCTVSEVYLALIKILPQFIQESIPQKQIPNTYQQLMKNLGIKADLEWEGEDEDKKNLQSCCIQ